MAKVLRHLNVSAVSSSSQLLSGRKGLRQSSSQSHPEQTRPAIGAWKGTSIIADGLKQDCSLRGMKRLKGTGSRCTNQVSSSRRDDGGVITVDSRRGYPGTGSATLLFVNQVQLERGTATDSATEPPAQAQMVQPMDTERRGDAEHQHPYSDLKVAPRWREIQGDKQWAGLLDPLDPVLRGEIIRYGEFSQATYDAFDSNVNSPYCGSSKYNKELLLRAVGLENRGYEVTDYLYATAGEGNPVASFLRKIDFDETDDIDPDEVWDPESNWMGYVAVCTDPTEIARLGRRDIVIVWRGTVTKLEWLENLRDFLLPTGFDPRRSGQGLASLKVEAGFLQLYKATDENSKYCKTSAREQVLKAVWRLVHKYRFDELSITVTGHSLGSALANICAYDLAESRLNLRLRPHEVDDILVPDWKDPNGLAPRVEKLADQKMGAELGPIPITVFSFAGPRVGNDAFRDRMEELGVKVLRVVNKHDKVPKVPGLVFNEKLQFLEDKIKPLWKWLDSLPWTYSHVGVMLELDNLRSPFLRNSTDALSAHNLEAYLHLVEGYHTSTGEFKLPITRDIALVNKASDFLKPRYFIPSNWYQEENKGLIRNKHGKWVPRPRDTEDRPKHRP